MQIKKYTSLLIAIPIFLLGSPIASATTPIDEEEQSAEKIVETRDPNQLNSLPTLGSESNETIGSISENLTDAPRTRGMQVGGRQENFQTSAPGVPHTSGLNWEFQYQRGARFVYTQATEDNDAWNRFHVSQVTQAKTAGLAAGSYHAANMSRTSPEAQARNFIDIAPAWTNDGLSLPPVVTPVYHFLFPCYRMNNQEIINWFSRFLPLVEEGLGRKPIISTTADWWSRCTGNTTAFNEYELLISTQVGGGVIDREPSLPASWQTWRFWQHWNDDARNYEGPIPLFPNQNPCTDEGCNRIGSQQVFNGTEEELFAYAKGSPEISSEHSELSASSGIRLDNGSDAHEIKLTLVDPSKRPITRLSSEEIQTLIGVQVDWSTVGEFSEILNEGEPTGTYVAPVVSLIAGKHEVVTRFWKDIQQTLEFGSIPIDKETSTLSTSTGTRITDNHDAHTVTAHLKAAGEPVKGLSPQTVQNIVGLNVDWSIVGEFSEVLNKGEQTGTYTAPVTSSIVGEHKVFTTLWGATSNTLTFQELSIAPEHIELQVSSGNRIANGSDRHTISLSIQTENSQPFSGLSSHAIQQAVGVLTRWSTVGEFVEILNDGQPTGMYEAPVTSTAPGDHEVVTRLTGNTQKTLSFIAPTPDADNSTLSVTAGTRAANGEDAHTITVALVDGLGNTITGLSSQDMQNTVGVLTRWSTVGEFVEILNDGSPTGMYEAPVTSTIPGQHSVITRLWGATDKTLSFQ